MDDLVVRKAPMHWLVGGIVLGMIQILGFGVKKPLGVSTQFLILDSMAVHKVAPEYAQNHPVISKEKYTKLGYGFWLDVGLVVGAAGAAVFSRRWKLRKTTVWWQANGRSVAGRMVTGFVGGFLILLGARMAHGCTSGQFASGWAQLSLSAVPFSITLFGFGMLTAWLVYPRSAKFDE